MKSGKERNGSTSGETYFKFQRLCLRMSPRADTPPPHTHGRSSDRNNICVPILPELFSFSHPLSSVKDCHFWHFFTVDSYYAKNARTAGSYSHCFCIKFELQNATPSRTKSFIRPPIPLWFGMNRKMKIAVPFQLTIPASFEFLPIWNESKSFIMLGVEKYFLRITFKGLIHDLHQV